MRRTPAEALAVECPRCGSRPGERCHNYTGAHCAPHADRINPRPAAPAPTPKPSRPAPPSLFELDTDDAGA